MRKEKVFIDNSNGETLRAVLEMPLNDQPLQFVVFAHCFTCSSDLSVVRNISRELTAYGYAVLRFDFTGLGKSEGEFADTNFSHNLSDLIRVNDWLIKNYQAPSLVIGHSLGGTAVLMAAAQLDNIKAVVAIGAPADPAHVSHLISGGLDGIKRDGQAQVTIGGRSFVVKRQFIEDLEKHDLRQVLVKMRKSVLIMHSPQDKIVGIENAAILYKSLHHPKSFISLDGADHLLSNRDDSIYAARMIATWSSKYLIVQKTILDKKDRQPDPKDFQTVAHLVLEDQFTTLISDGNHSLIADEPSSVGGNDYGFSPYGLVNAALGACTNMTLKLYAERKGWPLKEVYTYMSYQKIHKKDSDYEEGKEHKLDYIKKRLELVGDLSVEQKNRLLEIAEKCPVNRTLTNAIKIESELLV